MRISDKGVITTDNIKTGLVLEGGGMRGIYTAGVLDVFMENGIEFDGLIGVSAGAVHGCSFLSGQHGRSIRYYEKYCTNPRFMSLKSWLKTGDVAEVEFCYHELPDKLDIYDHEAFLKNKTPYFVTCTNVETGEAEYLRVTDMRGQIDFVRASASLPYFSRMVEINGKKYLDGGAADSIPLRAFQNMGYIKNVVVLTRDAGYRKKAELNFLPGLVYRKYPKFAETLKRRHEVYNETVEFIGEEEKRGSVFVIRPSVALDISRMESDPAKIRQTYDIGRADAEKALEDLKNWMKYKN